MCRYYVNYNSVNALMTHAENCVILLFRAIVEMSDHNLVVPSENDLLLEVGDVDADADADVDVDADSECADCKEAIDHKNQVLDDSQQYRRDRKENSYRSYAVEMQKILLMHKLSIKQHHFLSCLVFFNETFASLKPSSPGADNYL